MITSSPGFSKVITAKANPPDAAAVTITCSGSARISFFSFNFLQMAFLNSIIPENSVYLFFPSRTACMAASLTFSGTSKSGTPVLKSSQSFSVFLLETTSKKSCRGSCWACSERCCTFSASFVFIVLSPRKTPELLSPSYDAKNPKQLEFFFLKYFLAILHKKGTSQVSFLKAKIQFLPD